MRRMTRGGFWIAALVALAACAPDEPQLMNIRSETNGPDEFSILPPKPLS